MEVGVMSTKGGYGSTTSMEVRWAISSRRRRKVPIYISTNPSDINPVELRKLYSSCNHSCHRFPNLDHRGQVVDAVDLNKLDLAISNSSLLISVFCNSENVVVVDELPPPPSFMGLVDILRGLSPFDPLISPSHSQLVGFGRAVSDFGLTASIYDVMVVPSLRGMGIGRMIVTKITRMLTRSGIYDISALCSANERLFFKACGFGDDVLGSTTMMYARTVSSSTYPGEGDQMVKLAGRRRLLAPPSRKPFGPSQFYRVGKLSKQYSSWYKPALKTAELARSIVVSRLPFADVIRKVSEFKEDDHGYISSDTVAVERHMVVHGLTILRLFADFADAKIKKVILWLIYLVRWSRDTTPKLNLNQRAAMCSLGPVVSKRKARQATTRLINRIRGEGIDYETKERMRLKRKRMRCGRGDAKTKDLLSVITD